MMNNKRFTEKRNGKNVIPLRNAVCGIELPHWSIEEESEIQSFLSGEVADRLAELEDKIEQGTLIELPCKVGDTVYMVYGASGIENWEVTSICIYDHDTVLRLGHKGTNDYNATLLKETGLWLFFTREEAEKRLKELQE